MDPPSAATLPLDPTFSLFLFHLILNCSGGIGQFLATKKPTSMALETRDQESCRILTLLSWKHSNMEAIWLLRSSTRPFLAIFVLFFLVILARLMHPEAIGTRGTAVEMLQRWILIESIAMAWNYWGMNRGARRFHAILKQVLQRWKPASNRILIICPAPVMMK